MSPRAWRYGLALAVPLLAGDRAGAVGAGPMTSFEVYHFWLLRRLRRQIWSIMLRHRVVL